MSMPLESLKKLSLNELVTLLHNSLSNLSKNIEGIVKANRQLGDSDISDLRDHITARLQAHDNLFDNSRMLKVLELFSEDKKALEVMKGDIDEWITFLDAIRYNITQMEKDAGIVELKELDEIKAKIDILKESLRKE